MQVYVYEHMTAATPQGQDRSLEREGLAMVRRVGSDLAAVRDVDVTILWHRSRPRSGLTGDVVCIDDQGGLDRAIADSPRDARWLIIAPEIDGVLGSIHRRVWRGNRASLGPGLDFVDIASDKFRTFERVGPPVLKASLDPRALSPEQWVVAKPRFGAGSCRTARGDAESVAHWTSREASSSDNWPTIYQTYAEGQASSIAVVGLSSGEVVVLPAATQRIRWTPDAGVDSASYHGGELPIPANHDARMRRLAQMVLSRMPPFRGYIGIDGILGARHDGSRDVVLDVNPRLTTSYVGYSEWMRRRTGDEAAMGRLILGESVSIPDADPESGVVAYSPAGELRWK